jgi:hypothetical protein
MSVAVTRFLAGPLPTRLEGARQVATDYYLRFYLDRAQALESVGLPDRDIQVDS